MVNIYFDNVLLDADSVLKLTRRAKLFTDTFKLGSTVCKEYTLWVDKTAITNHPQKVEIKEDLGLGEITIATLLVDSVDDTNDYYYGYTLLDYMVKLNKVYNWEDIDNATVQTLVNDICSKYGLIAPTVAYAGDLLVNWQEYTTARELIGYVAELQGAFAIVSNYNLLFMRYENWSGSWELDEDQVADLTVGDHHKITRVVYDNLVHYEWGDSEGDTLYLNKDNFLFTDTEPDTDSEGHPIPGDYYTIDSMGNHIYELIKDFEFYDIKSSSMIIDNWEVGEMVRICGYPTIVEMDYSYNGMWIGGIDLQLKNDLQQETSVIDNRLERVVNSVNITIDRQNGIIDLMGETVDDIERRSIHFQVDAEDQEVRVTSQDTYDPDTYTGFKDDGMRIYVDGEQVAEATANKFNCDRGLGVQDWVIEKGKGPNALIFYRKR